MICDRCKKEIKDYIPTDETGMTAGYYKDWFDFTDEDEHIVCDDCMHRDVRYIAVYGIQFS